ncbi:MAG: UDP-N-acetylmuramoyl-L-alanine--D-glutamate ligase [Clostridia bacterium]|nr:UDP-N-acetylmuramoyl-L-alanine--D-glutamate ligase [Clostridia bacterium]
MNIKGKNVLVYGLGKSGRSALNLLAHKEANCFAFDDDYEKRALLRNNEKWESDFSNVDIVVLSPSISGYRPEIMDLRLLGKQVISEIELGYQFCDAELIAVSGTNGKTTTTMLIDEVLRAGANHSVAVGNIGTPFCELCDGLKTYETAVVEVSSFQLEAINKFSPDIAVLLNITPDHLDRHKSFEDYIATKARLFENQTECDIAVLNMDDENVAKLKNQIIAKIVPFSLTKKVDGVYIENGYVRYFDTPVLCAEELQFKGRELENVLATVAVAMEKHIHPFVIACAMKRFKRPEHRLQFVRCAGEKKYINDSKATNIDATLCACTTMTNSTLLVLGGQDKDDDFRTLFENLPKNITRIFVTGENAKDIEHSGKYIGFQNITVFDSLEECVLNTVGAEEQTVLFSPASKSFDRYKNYAERGKHFCQLVENLND